VPASIDVAKYIPKNQRSTPLFSYLAALTQYIIDTYHFANIAVVRAVYDISNPLNDSSYLAYILNQNSFVILSGRPDIDRSITLLSTSFNELKGTPASLLYALRSLDFEVEYYEWFSVSGLQPAFVGFDTANPCDVIFIIDLGTVPNSVPFLADSDKDFNSILVQDLWACVNPKVSERLRLNETVPTPTEGFGQCEYFFLRERYNFLDWAPSYLDSRIPSSYRVRFYGPVPGPFQDGEFTEYLEDVCPGETKYYGPLSPDGFDYAPNLLPDGVTPNPLALIYGKSTLREYLNIDGSCPLSTDYCNWADWTYTGGDDYQPNTWQYAPDTIDSAPNPKVLLYGFSAYRGDVEAAEGAGVSDATLLALPTFAEETLTITVDGANTVTIVSPELVSAPTVTLTPTYDVGRPSITTYTWSQVSGPSAVIATPSATSTSVSLTGGTGTYIFKILVHDGYNPDVSANVEVDYS